MPCLLALHVCTANLVTLLQTHIWPVDIHTSLVPGCSQMIADVEPLSGMRRYPSLSLGASWERHILSQQPTDLLKQDNEQPDMMMFGDEPPTSPGQLAVPDSESGRWTRWCPER